MNNIYVYLIVIIILYVLITSSKPRTKRKKSSSAKIKGEIGEKKIADILKTLPRKHYKIINDVFLKRKDGSTSQIDHIIVSTYGIFVIETKNYNGLITGKDNSEEWIQHLSKKDSYPFYSPTRQNYGHIKALKESLRLPENIFISIVVFLSDATLNVKSKYHVINDKELKKTILAYHMQKLDNEKVITIENQIKNLNISSKRARNKHVKYIEKNYKKR